MRELNYDQQVLQCAAIVHKKRIHLEVAMIITIVWTCTGRTQLQSITTVCVARVL